MQLWTTRYECVKQTCLLTLLWNYTYPPPISYTYSTKITPLCCICYYCKETQQIGEQLHISFNSNNKFNHFHKVTILFKTIHSIPINLNYPIKKYSFYPNYSKFIIFKSAPLTHFQTFLSTGFLHTLNFPKMSEKSTKQNALRSPLYNNFDNN